MILTFVLQSNREMQETELRHSSSVQIIEDVLVVNNCIVPYKEQILRNKNNLFIADLGIEVPVDDQLREYDQYYFQFLLKEQIIAEIQANHISVGLAILQSLPEIDPQHYAYIFRKLSLAKIKKMLMSDDYLVFLAQIFYGFIGVVMKQQITMEAIEKLVEPYQRIIFLLKILEEQSGDLKEEVHATAQEILYTMIDQANFIEKLAYLDHQKGDEGIEEEATASNNLDPKFLTKLYQLAISVQYIQRIPLQLSKEFSFSLNNHVKEKLFSKDCFRIVGQHFYDLSLNDRRNLLLIMNLMATYNCNDFWNELILSPSSKLQTQREEDSYSGSVSNANTLKVLLQSNYYSKNILDWDESMYLLQQLYEGKGGPYLMLTQFFEDIVQNPYIQAIDLFAIFTHKVFQRHKEDMPHFKRILTAFLTSISQGVERLHKDYLSCQRFHSNKVKSTIVMLMKMNFPRVNSLLVCAYFRVFNIVLTHNIYDFVSTIDMQKPIEWLLILSSNRGGVIEGSRKKLVKLIKTKIQNTKIKTRSSQSKSPLPLSKLRIYLQTHL